MGTNDKYENKADDMNKKKVREDEVLEMNENMQHLHAMIMQNIELNGKESAAKSRAANKSNRQQSKQYPTLCKTVFCILPFCILLFGFGNIGKKYVAENEYLEIMKSNDIIEKDKDKLKVKEKILAKSL